MKSYKYVHVDDDILRSVITGWVRFTPLAELNDPTEMLPFFDSKAVLESLARIREEGLTDKQFEWLRCQERILRTLAPNMINNRCPATKSEAELILRGSAFKNMSAMKAYITQVIGTIRAGVGVMSLSRRCDSLPMWAHYADNAAGVVVEYSELHSVFSGDRTGSLNELKPVQYRRDPSGMTFDPATQDDLFFSKFDDWQYEEEFRVVVPLSECDTNQKEGLYFKRIDRSFLSRVMIGWKVSDPRRAEIEELIRSENPEVRVSSARLDEGRIVFTDQGDRRAR